MEPAPDCGAEAPRVVKAAPLVLVFAIWLTASTAAWAQTAAANTFEALSTGAAAALQQKDFSRAVELYRKALAVKPSWAEGWFYLGVGQYELRRYAEARKTFERAAHLAPDKGAVWAFIGLSEYQQTDYSHALAHFQKAEKIGLPDNPGFIASVHNCAALIYLRRRDFQDGVVQIQGLAKIADRTPIAVLTLGIAGLQMPYLPANLPKAKLPLAELAGRALWALYAQSESDAKKLFPELIAKYPSEPGVHYLDGLYLVANTPEAARAQFETELKVNPSNASAMIQIGILDILAGNSGHAIPLAEAALRLEPQNALAHEVLGRAYMDTNQIAKAVPELEEAADLAPDNPQAHFYLERGYRRIGRLADARKQRAEFDRLRAAEQPTVYPNQMTTSRKGAVSGVFR